MRSRRKPTCRRQARRTERRPPIKIRPRPKRRRKRRANREDRGARVARRELTEEVKKVIRQRVADDKIKANFDKITASMNENAKAWKRYNSAITRKETNLAKPPKFDFAGEAAKYGFSAGKTGEIDKWQAAETDIGSFAATGSQGRSSRSVLAAFDIARNSRPSSRADMKGNLYLFWKIKDVKETAPKWDDPTVQKQVLEAWQMSSSPRRRPRESQAVGRQGAVRAKPR